MKTQDYEFALLEWLRSLSSKERGRILAAKEFDLLNPHRCPVGVAFGLNQAESTYKDFVRVYGPEAGVVSHPGYVAVRDYLQHEGIDNYSGKKQQTTRLKALTRKIQNE